MNSTLEKIVVGAVLVIVGVVIGYALFHSSSQFGSPVNTTFTDAKVAAIDMTPLTSAATSTSILNGDASARWVKSVDVACTGVGSSQAWNVSGTGGGLSAWQLQVATTSTAAQNGSTNYVANINPIATSTSFSQTASSTIVTAATSNTDLYYWPAGVYLTFTFNATNTAACVVSASYIPS